MPFVLLFIGLILVVSAAQGTVQALGAQLAKDFTGPNNFVNWIAAIGLVGAVGYVPSLQKFSRVFLGLILLAIFFSGSKQGFWAKLQGALNAIGSGGSAAPNSGGLPAQAGSGEAITSNDPVFGAANTSLNNTGANVNAASSHVQPFKIFGIPLPIYGIPAGPGFSEGNFPQPSIPKLFGQ